MNLYDLKALRRDDTVVDLRELKGKITLVVNTATGCGFTPQYEALEKLYKKYHDKGFEILDFPCNQFGHQAPGTDDEIHEFCTAKYQTTFDQLKKVDVNGDDTCEVFKYLKDNSPEEEIHGLKNKMAMKGVAKISNTCKKENDIKWNFTKFLVDKEGKVIRRLSPIENPMLLDDTISGII